MKIIKTFLIVIVVFMIVPFESAICIENVGNRYGIDTTIGPYTD